MKTAMTTTAALLVLGSLLLVPGRLVDAQEQPQKLRDMLLTLDERRVNVDFKEQSLEDVLKFFTDFTGVSLTVSPMLLEHRDDYDLTVTLRLSGVSVRTVLNVILDLKGLAAVYRYGIILITTPEDARGKPVLQIYSIGDLTVKIRDFPAPDLQLRPAGAEDFGNVSGGVEEGKEHAFADPEFIMDLVMQNTGLGTWEDDGVRINVTDRHLIVRTYPGVHREVAGLLNLLRAYR